MKNSVLALGVFTASIFIGVGFLSGKETALFFLPYSSGAIGIILTCVLISLFSLVVIAYFKNSNGIDLAKFKFVGAVLSFLIISVTISGAGEVIKEVTKINSKLASFIVCVAIILFSKRGEQGLAWAGRIAVPLTVFALAVGYVLAVFKFGYHNSLNANNQPISPFLPNVVVSAITYSGFSVLTAIGVFKSNHMRYGEGVKSVLGVIISGFIMLILLTLTAFLISAFPSSISAELPVLSVIKNLSTTLYYATSALILTVALSLVSTHLNSIAGASLSLKKAIVLFLAYLSSLIGFSKLISIVYPIIGWLGVFMVILFVIKLLKR